MPGHKIACNCANYRHFTLELEGHEYGTLFPQEQVQAIQDKWGVINICDTCKETCEDMRHA